MTATFSGPQKLLLEQRKEEKKVKETTSNLLTMTNPAELLKGIRMSKVQQEQNFEKKNKNNKKKKKKQPQEKPQTKNIIADCRRRSFIKIVWSNWVLKTNF